VDHKTCFIAKESRVDMIRNDSNETGGGGIKEAELEEGRERRLHVENGDDASDCKSYQLIPFELD
jgi:hypothetical protein